MLRLALVLRTQCLRDAQYRTAAPRRGSKRGPSNEKGTFPLWPAYRGANSLGGSIMDGIIYLVGLIVIIMAILSFFGLR
jgi:hypothetical protein